MIDKYENTSGNHNSLLSFAKYNWKPLLLILSISGAGFMAYSGFKEFEVYQHPITNKKHIVIKEDGLSTKAQNVFLKGL